MTTSKPEGQDIDFGDVDERRGADGDTDSCEICCVANTGNHGFADVGDQTLWLCPACREASP